MTTITARELVEALGISKHAAEYEFTDQCRIRYTGTPSHLVLAAFAREDVTDVPRVVRDVAQLFTEWFTCDYVEPAHAAAFAEMPPAEVCELIAHVATHGDLEVLSRVGPQSLATYTAYLLEPRDAGVTFPTIVNSSYHALVEVGVHPGARLQIVPEAPDGVSDVEIPVAIEATETYSWDFRTRIAIPVSDLNALLMAPRSALCSFIEENRDQIENDLSATGGEGLNVVSAQPTMKPKEQQA